MRKLIPGFLLIWSLLLLTGCEEYGGNRLPLPCSPCGVFINIDTNFYPGSTNSNFGKDWYVPIDSVSYVTLNVRLTEIHPEYVREGIPRVETLVDSDTWYVYDNIGVTLPLFYPFSSGYLNGNTTPVSTGDSTFTIPTSTQLTNAVGYVYGKQTFLRYQYSYTFKIHILVYPQMKGKKITVYTTTRFNTDLGPQYIVPREFNLFLI